MTGLLNFRKQDHVSLQFKDHVIRCVITKEASEASMVAFYEKAVPEGIIEKGKIIDETNFVLILEECIANWKLKRKNIKFLVPDSSIFFRKLSLPNNLTKEEIRGHINFEIGTSIHLPFEDASFDFHILDSEEETETIEILFFAVPEPLLKQYVKHLEDGNTKPDVADVAALSLYRFYYLNYLDQIDDDAHIMLLEWDMTSINVSVFNHHKPIFLRSIPHYLDVENWEMTQEDSLVTWKDINSEKIDGDLADSFTEIERVIDFYKYTLFKGEKEVSKIFLTGDHPMLMKVKKMLENSTGLEIEMKHSIGDIIEDNSNVANKFLLPLSLCLKEV
ncbi:pilus assembly protein PilM [Salipaludibacillus neizhouensis]|uniref:Pilus assembly protein PilM n=1 Tax=Salipaludibacillus neizhouensis TaxID=885475 RepID=A0A3A9K8E7_9BACI|nr:pilus assembly protein PilM [Salipaludibacillus neizhouensis]RKL65913.1 pilus assembly protein PilM [Salipaludibacillus neizhouensis]